MAIESVTNSGIMKVSDGGFELHIGSSGDGALRFRGDLALLRVFSRQLDATERAAMATTLISP